MSDSKYSNEALRAEIEGALSVHMVQASDNGLRWAVDNIVGIVEQTRTNTIKAALEALPETEGMDARFQVGVAECAISLMALIGGDDE